MSESLEPTRIDRHVGERMRMQRHARGLSQSRLGELLGCSFQQVQKYEKGHNRLAASTLYAAAAALSVPVGFFYDGLPAITATETEEQERIRLFRNSRLGCDMTEVAAFLPAPVLGGFIVAMSAVAGNAEVTVSLREQPQLALIK